MTKNLFNFFGALCLLVTLQLTLSSCSDTPMGSAPETASVSTEKTAPSFSVPIAQKGGKAMNELTGTVNISTFPYNNTGYISSSTEQDYFYFNATVGQTVTVNLAVPSSKDYDLYLLNTNNTTLKASEAGTGASESVTFTFTIAGQYYISVIGYNGAFSTSSPYTLNATLTGGSTGGGGNTGGSDETESNGTTGTANALGTLPKTLSAKIGASGDQDFFSFSATAGQTITMGMTVPSSKDYDLYLVNASGSTLKSSEAGTGAGESITHSITADGIYYAKVIGYNGAFSTTDSYTLTVSASGGSTGGGGTPPPSDNVHLTLGNPSGAVASTSSPANYLMEKAQFALSYNRDKGIPNWVAWHLDNSWIGSASRQDDFRADNTLPSGWYQVGGSSYSGSGFDRGHNCPSADRTNSTATNSSTFLMTNMIPQAPDNNQGPWANLENYTRTLLSGNEVYVYMGQYGVGGTGSNGAKTTINNGQVTVPNRVWKVIVIIPSGSNDASRVSTSTRVIAVDMPNTQGIRSNDWRSYRVSVDQIESAANVDLLNAVSASIQSTIESRVDNQ